ncbi:MAG: hypothetical protein V1800_04445 [Candidatus Latescibacterota bacterium]
MLSNRFGPAPVILLLIVGSFLVAGCYTILMHPQISQKESNVTEEAIQGARSCTDCHSEMQADGYHHDPFYGYDPFFLRGPFYVGSYYTRLHYYRTYPWWWDRYERGYNDRRYREDRYDPRTDKVDPPREETKRDWYRRSGFGTGGGIGVGGPQARSRSAQSSDESVKPESKDPEPKPSVQSEQSSKQEEKEKEKAEEKKEEKKPEGRSRRREGFN